MQRTRWILLGLIGSLPPGAVRADEALTGLQADSRKAVRAFLRQQDAQAQPDEAWVRDLDGDGQTELLLRWTAHFGNSQLGHLTVFRQVKGRWQAGPSETIRGDPQGGLRFDADGSLALRSLTTGPNDPRCCPSLQLQLRWRYEGGRLRPLQP